MIGSERREAILWRGQKAGEVVVALDFSLSVDQEAIADAFGAFFAAESPIDVVRGAEPLGYSPRLWQKLGSLEAPGMSVSPHAGGGGATLSDLVVVAEALGESIAPVPLVEHWVASRAYPTPEIVSGDQIAAIALRPSRCRRGPGGWCPAVLWQVLSWGSTATNS